MMIYNDCRDCKYYEGDCGKHHIDIHEHIRYDIPRETYMDGAIDAHGSCFQPSKMYQEEKTKSLVKDLTAHYTIDELQMALDEVLKALPGGANGKDNN